MGRASLGAVRIHDYSGQELENVAGEVFVPVIARTAPGYRGRMALHELGETLALPRSYRGPMSAVRTAGWQRGRRRTT
jgi:hypothetical protein